MADEAHARRVAREFVTGLAANGTTTALVFGSHFPAAQEALFEEAERSGLRIASGLVVSDRNLLPELHVDPDAAYDAGRELAGRWHGRGRLRYAVTPRFSLSCSEGMLEACGALHGEVGALVTSHMNENLDEVEAVRGPLRGVRRLPPHLRALRPRGRVDGARPQRPPERGRAGPARCGARERGALPGEQRVPRQRPVPAERAPRPRRAGGARHGRRRGNGAQRAEGGADGLPAADAARRRAADRPRAPAASLDARRRARARPGRGRRPLAGQRRRLRAAAARRPARRSRRCCATATRPSARSAPCSRSRARRAWPRCGSPARPFRLDGVRPARCHRGARGTRAPDCLTA